MFICSNRPPAVTHTYRGLCLLHIGSLDNKVLQPSKLQDATSTGHMHRTDCPSPILKHQQPAGCSCRCISRVWRGLSQGREGSSPGCGELGGVLGVILGGSRSGAWISPVQRGPLLRGATLQATHCCTVKELLTSLSYPDGCQLTNRICMAGGRLIRSICKVWALPWKLGEISTAVKLLRSSRRRLGNPMGFVTKAWGCCWVC